MITAILFCENNVEITRGQDAMYRRDTTMYCRRTIIYREQTNALLTDINYKRTYHRPVCTRRNISAKFNFVFDGLSKKVTGEDLINFELCNYNW